ncbi:interleukin-10 [Amblyraja radiata]|uniref:interleukin-10 n=1 Tax=Amblyraja radiata TaxID=386614 RepID=UPI001403F187|nr:interleukin-10 [Amblyraja radiata]
MLGNYVNKNVNVTVVNELKVMRYLRRQMNGGDDTLWYRATTHQRQNKDDNFKISLLRRRDLPEFKDNHSCQFLKEMLNFYLTDVIPAAKTHSRVINTSVSKIGNALHELHANVQKCHLFFSCDRCSCNQTPHFRNIQRTFKQLQVKGVYKAMSELNTFIDWIWNYINMKKNSS